MSYIGKTYGDFTVVALHSNNKSGIKYRCRCNLCGKDKILKQSDFWHMPMHPARACEPKRVRLEKKKEETDPCGGRKDCAYWRTLDTPVKCCHYCIVNRKTRDRDKDGNCMSYDNTEEAKTRVRRILHGMA